MLTSLEQLLEFRHQRVIERYQRDNPHKANQAEKIFPELLKYLWLCDKHAEEKIQSPDDEALNFLCVMHEEMRDMDNMWHAFILFTHDYAEFCDKYFGKFVHHVPNVRLDMPQTPEEFEKDFNKYLDYVYERLGEETLRTWFAEHLCA